MPAAEKRFWTSQEFAINLKPLRNLLRRQTYLEFRAQAIEAMGNVTRELYGADKVLSISLGHIQDHPEEPGRCRNNGLCYRISITIEWWPVQDALETSLPDKHTDRHRNQVLQAVLSLFQHHLSTQDKPHLVRT